MLCGGKMHYAYIPVGALSGIWGPQRQISCHSTNRQLACPLPEHLPDFLSLLPRLSLSIYISSKPFSMLNSNERSSLSLSSFSSLVTLTGNLRIINGRRFQGFSHCSHRPHLRRRFLRRSGGSGTEPCFPCFLHCSFRCLRLSRRLRRSRLRIYSQDLRYRLTDMVFDSAINVFDVFSFLE